MFEDSDNVLGSKFDIVEVSGAVSLEGIGFDAPTIMLWHLNVKVVSEFSVNYLNTNLLPEFIFIDESKDHTNSFVMLHFEKCFQYFHGQSCFFIFFNLQFQINIFFDNSN